jgi:hypothetical protein
MLQKTLSSGWTYGMKFLFPVLWISGFGLGSLFLWSKAPADAVPPYGFFAAWLAVTAFILWTSVGLKRVRVDERRLYVSNYLREISVPFTAIADVKQNRWLRHRPVTIYFKEATGFGDRVTFMPKQRLNFWSVDPTVSELRRLARLAD